VEHLKTADHVTEKKMKISLGPKTLAQPAPLWIIGSYDEKGRPCAMAAAWGGICCSKPPCLTVSLREERHSYAGILERKAFTVSVPSVRYAAQADFFGIVSGRDTDKFAAAGLTPVRSEVVDAPYVSEFPLILECSLVRTVPLGMHVQFIGEILDVKADEDVLDDKGYPDAAKVQPLIFTPVTRAYHTVGEYVGQAFEIGRTFCPKE
jgi:flavin reductase (DIM6/NTAB) family NADH-FMN oxidoreductase RutF